ncbi:MAG: carboxypeptidase M32 [Fusobacterium gastrosuis]|uniref:carboxypeptidase M32 n=2 Tax=Fusobacterium TaxID=848 RepID=UPI0025E86EA9|nr:carboxypeptidase M32 [uncultured Fusobacterium sp.]MDY4011111.1 carboxypeptidase M32 [Fusobacterium gastrosuis]
MRERFREIIKEKNKIAANLALVSWDLETRTPKKGQKLLAELNADLSMKEYNLCTSEEFENLVDNLNKTKDKLTEIEKREIELSLEEIEKMKKIPAVEYEEYSKLTALNQGIWEEAKAKKDFSIVKDNLKKIFEYNKKFAGYRKTDEKTIYDVLLNDYEKGMDSEKLDKFFDELKKEIVPLLRKIQEKNKESKKSKLDVKMDKNIQLEFAKYIAEYVGFDFERGILDLSEHPFTLNLNKNDVRLTTKNILESPFSTIFSTIHEAGHGIYEQQTADELVDTLLGTGGSMGLHESQSRFMENIVGRSYEFWSPLYEKAQEFYPFLKEIEFSEFYKEINRVDTGLIRTEADELTYSLHIMLRYELEKLIFADELSIDDLPKVWRDKMQEYLGLSPENDSEGLMQDIHWYAGLIGYFPSYAIGNAYSVQILNTMKKDLDIEKILKNGEIFEIKNWLGEKIHKYGKLKNTSDLIKEITGEDLNAKYYIDYLKEKYTKIYNLD